MTGFALFRLPDTRECTLLSGEVVEASSCAGLTGRQGFVVAPFAPSAERPFLVIRPDHVHSGSLSDISGVSCASRTDSLSCLSGASDHSRADYHTDFANFHARLLSGGFQKLVLSRSISIARQGGETPLDLFCRASERYPRMFISLVHTPESGMWLAATPEVLLAGTAGEWQTVALAGTMPFSEEVLWSDKNIQEQRYVATYVTGQLETFTARFTEDGPHTVRAGHLAHLRSDFRFTLSPHKRVGEVLQALHPTPAVCGLPKQAAFRFILQNEHHDRSYYSGFMGPLSVNGRTHLFVTLRCMQIFQDGYRLYAGGGLLTDSDEEQEWQETETKLDTMRNIIIYNV